MEKYINMDQSKERRAAKGTMGQTAEFNMHCRLVIIWWAEDWNKGALLQIGKTNLPEVPEE